MTEIPNTFVDSVLLEIAVPAVYKTVAESEFPVRSFSRRQSLNVIVSIIQALEVYGAIVMCQFPLLKRVWTLQIEVKGFFRLFLSNEAVGFTEMVHTKCGDDGLSLIQSGYRISWIQQKSCVSECLVVWWNL